MYVEVELRYHYLNIFVKMPNVLQRGRLEYTLSALTRNIRL